MGGFGKELWIAAHEEIVEELMEANPDMTESQACAKADWLASDRAGEKFADMIDAAKDRAKAEGNWPPKGM